MNMIIIKAPILFEIQDFQERSGRISMQITLSSFINFIEKFFLHLVAQLQEILNP